MDSLVGQLMAQLPDNVKLKIAGLAGADHALQELVPLGPQAAEPHGAPQIPEAAQPQAAAVAAAGVQDAAAAQPEPPSPSLSISSNSLPQLRQSSGAATLDGVLARAAVQVRCW